MDMHLLLSQTRYAIPKKRYLIANNCNRNRKKKYEICTYTKDITMKILKTEAKNCADIITLNYKVYLKNNSLYNDKMKTFPQIRILKLESSKR